MPIPEPRHEAGHVLTISLVRRKRGPTAGSALGQAGPVDETEISQCL